MLAPSGMQARARRSIERRFAGPVFQRSEMVWSCYRATVGAAGAGEGE